MKLLSSFRNKSEHKNINPGESTIKTGNNSSYLHLSKSGIIKNVSNDFCLLTGYNHKVLKGSRIKKIVYRNDHLVFLNAINDLSADSPFLQIKIKLLGNDAQIIHTEIYLTLTSLEEGAPVFAIFRKAGTHQERYDHLFEKNEKLRLLAENTNHVQMLFDTDLKCLYLSKSCYSLTGYKYKELLNTDLYELIHHKDFNFVWETLNYPGTHKENTIVFRIKHKNGNYLWVETRIKKIFDAFNSITHYALYIHDASRHKHFEKQLQIAKEAAESANRLKSEFLSSISHEFRTPLNVIIGFSKIIAELASDAIYKTYANGIEQSGNQLLKMVNELLSYSKLEKNEIKASVNQIHIHHFFNDILNRAKEDTELNKKQNLQIFTDFQLYENDIFLKSDQKILTQIFLNLIGNAIKFTNEGYVKFGCKPYGINNYIFYVEDTGIGISPKHQKKIFEILTQKDGSLTRQYGGVGIGLSVTKKLVQLLDGEIWLLSEEGAGTAFYFTLPGKGLRE